MIKYRSIINKDPAICLEELKQYQREYGNVTITSILTPDDVYEYDCMTFEKLPEPKKYTQYGLTLGFTDK